MIDGEKPISASPIAVCSQRSKRPVLGSTTKDCVSKQQLWNAYYLLLPLFRPLYVSLSKFRCPKLNILTNIRTPFPLYQSLDSTITSYLLLTSCTSLNLGYGRPRLNTSFVFYFPMAAQQSRLWMSVTGLFQHLDVQPFGNLQKMPLLWRSWLRGIMKIYCR